MATLIAYTGFDPARGHAGTFSPLLARLCATRVAMTVI